MTTRDEEKVATPDVMLINLAELEDHPDLRVRMEAVFKLTRLVELLEPARQDPDYVECVGDAELFAHLTWATAQIAAGALELYEEQHPRPVVKRIKRLDGGRA